MSDKKTLTSVLSNSGKNDISIIFRMFNLALELINKNQNLMDVTHKHSSDLQNLNKIDITSNVDYEYPAAIIMRNYKNDRKFPLETVQLKVHETEHNENLEGVVIHTGAYADELARSLHLFAFALGKNIFFRNGTYKPETEEGRALLAHELKHVSQYKERPSEDNRTNEQLEAEAEIEEQKALYESDPFVETKINNETFRIRKSKLRKIEALAEKELERWIEQQEKNMNPEEYLKLLCRYEEYLGVKQ